jgi:putative hemolysin
MSPLELIFCLVLVFISGYISSSEIALFSLSRFQLRAIKEHLRPSVYQTVRKLLADPGGMLVTILVLNELVNISLSAIITGSVASVEHADPLLETASTLLPSWAIHSLLGTLITAPIVLFFCEITPKVIGAKANQLIASLTAEPLGMLYTAFKPVRTALGWILLKAFRLRSGSHPHRSLAEGANERVVKESDFLLMLEEGHREGSIRENELGLIKKVFELDDTTVMDSLKPLAAVVTIPEQTTVKAALNLIRNQKYSRIPVVNAAKKVVGILYAKDLLRAKLDPELLPLSISVVMRKPLFVNQQLRLNSLFRKFKRERTHLAVVQSDRGETLGIVTMGDVLDTLFEELLDEEDEA